MTTDITTAEQVAFLRAENARLRHELDVALNHEAFHCRTRRGVELALDAVDRRMVQFAVAADLDNMHHYNNVYGHDGMDARIAQMHDALGVRRDDETTFGGQIGGGDEFGWVFASEADAAGFAHRVVDAAKDAGISVTVGVARAGHGDLNAVVKPAFAVVEQAKRAAKRGRVHTSMPTVSLARQLINRAKSAIGVRV